MKKTYQTPAAEKIRFRYAEQVAASAGDGSSTGGSDGNLDIGDIIDRLYQFGSSADCAACESLFAFAG